MTQRSCVEAPKTVSIARDSARSPIRVPVAWALMKFTSCADISASRKARLIALAACTPSGWGEARWCASLVIPAPISSACTGACRALASSSRSSTIAPAPSLRTKPSRSAANGRQEEAGSSSLEERARISENPRIARGWIADSAPPTSTASTFLASSNINPHAIASAPPAQAETGAWAPPQAPISIEICAVAALGMAMAMPNG